MDMIESLKKVLAKNCVLLKIAEPKLKAVPQSFFATETTLSAVSGDGEELMISQLFLDKYDEYRAWMICSHECRHIWQIRSEAFGAELERYKHSGAMSLEDYNDQLPEVDAWAWTFIILLEKFSERPMLEDQLGRQYVEKVMKRVGLIIEKWLF